ncbi:MAG: alpha/beta fold hydrolase [Desulfatirhabdiaceae bacterium]
MMKKFKIVFMVLFMMFPAFSLFAAPVPDTGQTKCYNDSVEIPCPSPGQDYYGQDASYSINPPSYTKLDSNGNALSDSATSWSMVKDNVTGLIWEVKTNKDGNPNYSDPHDADNIYTWYDSNWATNGGNAGTPGDGTDTEDFIKALNNANYGGHSDWRLPTIKELAFIVDRSIPYPGPTIHTAYFPNTAASWYWSSTTYANHTNYAWSVYFFYGYDDYGNKTNSNYVRAVRGGQSGSFGNSVIGSFETANTPAIQNAEPAGGFVDNGDGTVTDSSTGLTWQQETPDNAMTWKNALAYCEGLSLGGHSDWRLPTINELRSLVDYSRYNRAINTTYFPDTAASWYWSSTTYASNTYLAWFVDFSYGYGNKYNKSNNYYVRAVRGGQSGSFGYSGYLVISAVDSPQQVGDGFPVTITAKDGYGNTNSGFNGTVYLSSSLGNMNPSSVYLTNGTATCNVTLYYGGNGYISASGSGLYGQSNYFDVTGANAGTGKLTGFVRDKNKNPVPNATVYLGSLTKITNNNGYFEFSNLPCKTYTIYAKAQDEFKSQSLLITIGPSNPYYVYLNIVSYCGPETIPILLVPGIMGSSTGPNDNPPTLPKSSPVWNDSRWRTGDNDSFGLYDFKKQPGWRYLIEDLKSHGYYMDCNLFAVPYDWRMPIKDAAEKYLKEAIKYVKDQTQSTKVHVIAHSMGGLLTRYYIQNIDSDDIDRFAMVGTPNSGSATPYYMWFGGDPKKADDITSVWNPASAYFNFYSNTTQCLYKVMHDGENLFPVDMTHVVEWSDAGGKSRTRQFYQSEIKSMGQLLSTDLFLQRDNSFFGLATYNQNNTFIEDLNKNIDFKSVDKRLFAGSDKNTIRRIYVGKPNEMYVCGVPKGGPDMPDEGDGTVLLSSAEAANVTAHKPVENSSHATLIKTYRDEIISFITGEAVQTRFLALDEETATPVLNLSIDGPVSPYLVSPSGKKLGFDPSTGSIVNDFSSGDMKMDSESGFMSIENPEDGIYTLNLTSSYQRNFRGTIGYSDETRFEQTPFAGFVGSGAFTIRFTVGSAASPVISVDPQLLPPEGLQADPLQNNGLKTYLSWLPGTQQAITGYKIYGRMNNEPYLSLLWTGAAIGLNTGHAWAENDAITPYLYAVSAVLSDGTETLISDMITNDDRDHDGLTDAEETGFGSDMTLPDTDGDGLTDSEEYIHGTSPIKMDTDEDGYSDKAEVDAGSDPLDPESEPIQPGDINGDQGVNLADAIMALQVLAGMIPDGTVNLLADVDGDNRIGMAEVIYVLQQVAGL